MINSIDDLLQRPRKGEAAYTSISSWLFSMRVDSSIDVRCASCRQWVEDDVRAGQMGDQAFST